MKFLARHYNEGMFEAEYDNLTLEDIVSDYPELNEPTKEIITNLPVNSSWDVDLDNTRMLFVMKTSD